MERPMNDEVLDRAAMNPATAEASGPPHTPKASLWRRILLRQETTLAGVIVIIGVAIAIWNPAFATSGNLVEILRDTVIFFIMGCGSALIIIGGGFDFSVGSTFTLGSMAATFLMVNHIPWPIAILGGLVIGAFVGLVNALIIERLGVPPIITTLGTYYVFYGIVVVISGGNSILGLPQGFLNFGQLNLLGIPLIVIYAVVVGLIFWILLEKTPFGVNNRAVGGNRSAAVSSGLPVRRVERWLYVLGGMTAAFAGIVYAARTGVGDVSAGGADVTLTVVSGVLIGGISLFGGIGTITGVALGALLLTLIKNALALTTIPALFDNVIVGVILILAVAADYFRRKGSRQPRKRV